MKSRLAVLMVADVVGYSRMMAEDERAAISVVQQINDGYIAPHTTQSEGEILKRMGDGWILAFGSVTGAIDCATSLLGELVPYSAAKIRIGSHIGEIVTDDADFYGAGLNLAARLQSEAPPGGLMISQDLFRQLTGQTAQQFSAAGTYNLKNIPYPVEGFQWRPAQKGKIDNIVPSVIVEPFRSVPDDAETRNMSNDLREQIIMSLSSRTGVKTLDGNRTDCADVTYALRGAMRRSGDQARVNISLTLNESGETLFSQNYHGKVSEFFEFADETVSRVNNDIRVQTNAYDANRLADLPDEELNISELRSRAAKCFYMGTYKDWQRGHDLTDRALCLNPSDPMSLAMRALSEMWLTAARYERLSPDRISALEEDFVSAMQQVPRSDFVLQARAFFHAFCRNDAAACLKDCEKALAISPDYVIALGTKAMGYGLMGRFKEAIASLSRARDLTETNPLRSNFLFQLASYMYCDKDYESAAEILGEAIDLRPTCRNLYTLRALALEKAGHVSQAAICRERAGKLPNKPEVTTSMPILPDGFDDLLEQLRPTQDAGEV